MGRSVKFPRISRSYQSTSVILPTGTTAQRPATPINGTFRYNTDLSKFEMYQNGTWESLAARGNATITKNTFTGDGVSSSFTPLSVIPPNDQSIIVFVGNVHQNAGVAYTTGGTSTITFTSIPNAGQTIEVYHGFASTDR